MKTCYVDLGSCTCVAKPTLIRLPLASTLERPSPVWVCGRPVRSLQCLRRRRSVSQDAVVGVVVVLSSESGWFQWEAEGCSCLLDWASADILPCPKARRPQFLLTGRWCPDHRELGGQEDHALLRCLHRGVLGFRAPVRPFEMLCGCYSERCSRSAQSPNRNRTIGLKPPGSRACCPDLGSCPLLLDSKFSTLKGEGVTRPTLPVSFE